MLTKTSVVIYVRTITTKKTVGWRVAQIVFDHIRASQGPNSEISFKKDLKTITNLSCNSFKRFKAFEKNAFRH